MCCWGGPLPVPSQGGLTSACRPNGLVNVAFLLLFLVGKWRGVSGRAFGLESEWGEEKKRSEGRREGGMGETCCKRRYVPNTWWSIHFESSKNSFRGRRRKEFTRETRQNRKEAPTRTARVTGVMSSKRLGDAADDLAGGSGVESSHSDNPQ